MINNLDMLLKKVISQDEEFEAQEKYDAIKALSDMRNKLYTAEQYISNLTKEKYVPFYNYANIPEYFKATQTKYEVIPYSSFPVKSALLDEVVANIPDGCCVAGGFLVSLLSGENNYKGDIDFFFNSSKSFEAMVSMLKKPTAQAFKNYSTCGHNNKPRVMPQYEQSKEYRLFNYEPIEKINNKTIETNRLKLQLIKLWWFASPINVIDSFDIVAAQIATDGKFFYFNPQALEDIKNKEIHFHTKKQPALHAMRRILKYVNKGFTIKEEEYSDVAEVAAKFLVEHWNDIEEAGKIDKITNGEVYYMNFGENAMSYKFVDDIWKYLQGTSFAGQILGKSLKTEEDDKNNSLAKSY